ncbi:MAG: hypothetical protein Q7T80_08900 [Methanoregula sp.]|nr:hypothetical protein [Methanoregula sp.]
MGTKLGKIIDLVTSKKGFDGRMELAEKTGVAKTQAIEMEDTPDLIKRFKKEASNIIGEDIEKYL